MGPAPEYTANSSCHRRLGRCTEHVLGSSSAAAAAAAAAAPPPPPAAPARAAGRASTTTAAAEPAGAEAAAHGGGAFYDRGAAVTGGWMSSTTGGGAWSSHDHVRGIDLLWGGEKGQEGAILFAIDVSGGEGRVVEEHRVGAREFMVEIDHRTGRLWILNLQGLRQPGHMLQSWSPHTPSKLIPHGFPPLSNQRFAGAAIGADGRVWCGTHPDGHLTSFDPESGSWTDYGYLGQETAAEVSPGVVQQIWCYPQGFTEYGDVVITHQQPIGKSVAFNPRSRRSRVLSSDVADEIVPLRAVVVGRPSVNMARFARNDSRGIFSFLDADGQNSGAVSCCVDGSDVITDYTPKVATDICGLTLGPDGKIYGSTIISMNLFCFDPATQVLADLGKCGWQGAECYDLISAGGTLYLGSYPRAEFAEFDPTKPWRPRMDSNGRAVDANPRSFGPLGCDMNRPFEYTLFEPRGLIFIACRADYGIAGGGLACFDPITKEKRVFRDKLQSVQSVAADHQFVYGGTSIHGGRGCVDVTHDARLFIWDVDKHSRVFECIPVAGACAITSLALSNGLLVGTSASYLPASDHIVFVFDIQARQVTHSCQLRSPGTPLAGVPEAHGVVHITAATDGDIYGVSSCDVFKISLGLSTMRIQYLDTPPIKDLYQIVEGPTAGVFYIGARGHLLEYHVVAPPHYR